MIGLRNCNHVTWLNVPDLLTTQEVMQYIYHLSGVYLEGLYLHLQSYLYALEHNVALPGLFLYSWISNMAKNIFLVVLCVGATLTAAAPKSNTRVLRTNTQVTLRNTFKIGCLN